MKDKLIIGAFLLAIAAGIVFLAMPADTDSITAENRTAATVPPLNKDTVFSGSFAEGFESFVNDGVGYRSFLMTLSRNIENNKGFNLKAGRVISIEKDMGTGAAQTETVLAANNAVMEIYIKDAEAEQIYIDTVNYYAEKLPENIQLYSMIIPTQLSFEEPLYKNIQDDQKQAIDSIYASFSPRITAVDAYGEMEKHADEYIYFRTDHHWTQRGAYYGYKAFMNTSGGAAVNINDFEMNTISGIYGYFSGEITDADLLPEADTLEWYDVDPNGRIKTRMRAIDDNGEMFTYGKTMYDDTRNSYSFFFGSDHPIVELTNPDIPSGKTLVVLKDSYSNALAPWLIKSYNSVVLVDPRIYTGSFEDVLNMYSPDEVLIVNYIFTTNFKDYCTVLRNLY